MCAWNYDRTYAEEMRSASQVQSASSPGPGNDEHHLCVAVCRVSTLGASKVTFFLCFCFAFCLFHLPLTLHMIPIHIKVEVFKIFGFSVKKIPPEETANLKKDWCWYIQGLTNDLNKELSKDPLADSPQCSSWCEQLGLDIFKGVKTLTPRWNGDIM